MPDHIRIGAATPRVQCVADGAQRAFPYPFPIFDGRELEVFLGEAAQPSGYTITGAGDSSGGAVTFASAPVAGTLVTLRRQLSIQRTTDFQADGVIRAKLLNDELDYQTAAIQQVAEEVGRAVRRAPTSGSAADLTLPEPNAGRALKWNSAGTGLANSDADVDALAAQAATAATTATTKAAEANAAATTATTKAAQAVDAAQQAVGAEAVVALAAAAAASSSTSAQASEVAAQNSATAAAAAQASAASSAGAASANAAVAATSAGTAQSAATTAQGAATAAGNSATTAQAAQTAAATSAATAQGAAAAVSRGIEPERIPFNALLGECAYHDLATVVASVLAQVSTVPAGTVAPYAGSSAPSGWLPCAGQTVSRTTYAALFAVIGTSYGAGDGSTTFALPDLRGRTVIGAGQGSGLTARSVGQTGGAESHTLTVAELPLGFAGTMGPPYATGSVAYAGGGAAVQTGSGQAMATMPPFAVLNTIIKT